MGELTKDRRANAPTYGLGSPAGAHGPMRPAGFARRAGETPEFTKRRKAARAKGKAARAARKR